MTVAGINCVKYCRAISLSFFHAISRCIVFGDFDQYVPFGFSVYGGVSFIVMTYHVFTNYLNDEFTFLAVYYNFYCSKRHPTHAKYSWAQ